MGNIEREAEIEREIKIIILKRNILNKIAYLAYLRGQKEIKQTKAEERMEDAELEIKVIDKMIIKRQRELEEEEEK